MTKVNNRIRPGFVRVLVAGRDKTIQIRSQHANNPSYMQRHGLVRLPEPVAPPEPEPVAVKPTTAKAVKPQ